MRLRQAGLSAKPSHIAIGVPTRQLPGIDHLFPFGEQEMLTELVTADCNRRLADQLANYFPVSNLGLDDMRL
jgi:hypothetical protein